MLVSPFTSEITVGERHYQLAIRFPLRSMRTPGANWIEV
jgi:hypothetical protein